MKERTRKCRICGKEYEYCHTNKTDAFRWQDVACSIECGAIYFKKIEESRKAKAAEVETKPISDEPVLETKAEESEPKKKTYKRKKANLTDETE